jgi:hypothetical protein
MCLMSALAVSGGEFLFAKTLLGLSALRLLTAGVFRKSLRLPIPSIFGLFSRGKMDSVRHKIHENMWYSLWHTLSFTWNLRLLLGAPWFNKLIDAFDVTQLHQNFETFQLDAGAEIFLDVNLAFWTTCGLFLFVETIRKDFSQMLAHHVFTLALILGANFFRQQRFSLVVLLLHDVVDIFLYVAKTAVYLQIQRIADVCFAIFASSFLVSRLIIYPLVCIIPCWRFMLALPFSWMRYLPALLSALYVLHLFWWVMIVKVIRNQLAKEPTKDVRSDSEEEINMKTD